ncbi:MAG: SUMF1/EgtB/PvdO family nonheme iron enzyme [Verrucomicrobiales bacterium]|nr:SUMF1/EgtB/PvdO family nonheme iron enzyme [Verrucomicrobiales bacterium]
MKPVWIVAFVLGLLFVLPLPAAERVALVIGNDAYPDVVDAATGRARQVKLENCVSDAAAVRDMLRDQLGFPTASIIFGQDLTRTQFYKKLEAFKKAATGSELALVFYAGHGMESLDGRENFLIPVDADVNGAVESEALLRGTSVNLTEILSYVTKATSGPKVVLLDCCRDRPARRSTSGSAVEGGGLAQLPEDQIPADTLILLAAAPNKTASDGRGHGPFTAALLSHLPTPGMNILDAFFKVSDAVQEATGRQQVPWLKFDGSGTIFRQSALVGGSVTESTVPAMGVVKRKKIAQMQAEVARLLKGSTGSGDQATQVAALNAQLAEMQGQPSPKTPPATVPTPPAVPVVTPPTTGGGSSRSSLDRGAIGDSAEFKIGGGTRLVVQYVPAGEFMMGSPPEEVGRDDDENQVEVTLSRHFWMGETEVTQEQWEAVMGDNPSKFKGASLPVEQVSHEDAVDFVGKLNKKFGRAALPVGWHWTLPTEAQWEWACRGGTQTAFSSGNTLSSAEANFDDTQPQETEKQVPNLEKTVPVKSYAPNGYGLYDMHGNVFEWCAGFYRAALIGGTDPRWPETGPSCTIRGGSWNSRGKLCRAAYRFKRPPDTKFDGLGLRLAIVPAE